MGVIEYTEEELSNVTTKQCSTPGCNHKFSSWRFVGAICLKCYNKAEAK